MRIIRIIRVRERITLSNVLWTLAVIACGWWGISDFI